MRQKKTRAPTAATPANPWPIDLRAYDPPTLETLAASWHQKARYHLRQACRNARHGWLDVAWRDYGEASAAVSLLYDVHHPRCYGALKSLERVRRALARHFEPVTRLHATLADAAACLK